MEVDKNQFGFMARKSTTRHFHHLTAAGKIYRKKKLYHIFAGLENVFNKVPRPTIKLALQMQEVSFLSERVVAL